MKGKKQPSWGRWMTLITQSYGYLLGIFGVMVIANATGFINASFADGGQQALDADSFQATVCSIFGLMGQVVGGLAVVMIIAAGVTYAASGGTDKGNVGIGAAKNMLMSAITGVVLFLLGGLIVGDCNLSGGAGFDYGDLLQNFVGKVRN